MSTRDRSREMTRRTFVTAGGATILYLAGCGAVHGSPGRVTRTRGRYETADWIAVTDQSRVVVLVDKCEMGQGVRHMFASIVAGELGLAPVDVDVEDAPVDRARYGNSHILPTLFGLSLGRFHTFQMTGRSSSAADRWDKLRAAAAGTRRLLVAKAAEHLRVSPAEIALGPGEAVVRHDLSRRASFAALLRDGAASAPAPPAAAPCPVPRSPRDARWRVDARDKVTGRARFGFDIGLDDLREDGLAVTELPVALVVRPSRPGGSLRVTNRGEVERTFGVRLVDLTRNRGVAVVAQSFWPAFRARRAVQVDEGVTKPRADSKDIIRTYEERLRKRADDLEAEAPTTAGGEASAAATSWQTYVTPFGPHAAMEPLSATCVRDGDTYHIYAATQFPESAQAQVVQLLGQPDKKVLIHGLMAGGAFGRRAASDFIIEVADLCRQSKLPAVKLVWTREDDFRHDYLRPPAASRVRATAAAHTIASWEHLLISESPNLALKGEYLATFPLAGVLGMLPDRWLPRWRTPRRLHGDFLDITLEEGLADSVYEMPLTKHLLKVPRVDPPIHGTVRLGYWRSVGCFHTVFAVESMLDELAWASGGDPLELRLRTLRRSGARERQARMRACVETVAVLAGERNLRQRGTGFGLACFSGWDSFGALVVRVAGGKDQPGPVRVCEAWAAVDCGFVLNPDVLDQQVEGGIIFGLSAALKQEITTVNGAVRETNFHECDSLRIHECPTIHVVHQPYESAGAQDPTGVGELMVPLPAPAVANAVFNLTGRRLRRIPLDLGDDR